MSYLSELLSDSAWGVWRFEEVSGTTLADSSGNGRNASVTGFSPTYSQPSLIPSESTGKSATWPQSNAGAIVTSVPDLATYTVSVVYKPTGLDASGSYNYLASRDDNAGQDIFVLRTDGTVIQWHVRNSAMTYFSVSTNAPGGGPLTVGETYWFAGVFTGTTLELHGAKKDPVTGKFGARELLGTTAFSGARRTITPNLQIAHAIWAGGSYSAHGDMDTLALFSSALSQTRLDAHVNALNGAAPFVGWGMPIGS